MNCHLKWIEFAVSFVENGYIICFLLSLVKNMANKKYYIINYYINNYI